MSIVITDAVLVRLIWSLGGVEYAVNTLHYNAPALHTVNQASTDAFAAAVAAAATGAALPAQLATNVSLSRLTQRDRRVANQPEFSTGLTVVGTAVGDVLPPQTAMCITLRTALAGRGFRGRVYLPGWAEAASSPLGQAFSTAQTAGVNFITDLQSVTVSGNTLALAVARQLRKNPAPPPAQLPIEPGELNNVTIVLSRNLIWETQRRRAIPGI